MALSYAHVVALGGTAVLIALVVLVVVVVVKTLRRRDK